MADSSQAAPGLLASNLLASAEAHGISKPPLASSGLASIDNLALEGGFRYGEITSIAGTSGMGKTLVCTISSPCNQELKRPALETGREQFFLIFSIDTD